MLVATSDRDAFQLASERVTILQPTRGVSELARIDPAEVRDRYGVDPEQVPDLIALREEDAVTAGARRADHAVQHQRLAFELHDHVDFAVNFQRADRAARERHEHAFGADVADHGRQLLAAEQQPRVEVRVAPDGDAKREPQILTELLRVAHGRNLADLKERSSDRRLGPKRAAVARLPRRGLERREPAVSPRASHEPKRSAAGRRADHGLHRRLHQHAGRQRLIFVIVVVLLSALALFAGMG